MQDDRIHAGFAPRMAAYLIDLLLTGIGLMAVKAPFAIVKLLAGESLIFRELLFSYSLYDIFFYLLGKSYFVLMTYFTGSTLGKKCLHLQVVSSEEKKLSFWTVLYRETIGRYLSSLLGIGYLMMLLDKEKRGLHDRLADTRVVYAFPQQTAENPDGSGHMTFSSEI